MKKFLLVLALFSCAKHNKSVEPSASENLSALYDKKQFYCDEGRKLFADRTFMDDECDSALFTALFLSACHVKQVDLSAWHDGGKWYRNPKKDCYPKGAASSLSKDMALGLMTYWLSQGKKEDVADFISFGESHTWDMCGGDAQDTVTLISRCILSPSLITLLKDIYKKLDGQKVALTTPKEESLTGILPTGYEAHLEVLGILLTGKVYGAISDIQLSELKGQANRNPHNGLFVASYAKYGDLNPAVDLLLDQTHFPAGSLPNNHEQHCINYLYSKDEGSSDWSPCGDEPLRTHDGTDFVVAVSVIDGTL